MAEKNSTLVRTSRYVSGGISEVNSRAIEWWERSVIPLAGDDTTYVVEKRFEGRLDLITAVYLGEPRYWWVVAQYNNILDPVEEIREGVIIRIPSSDRIKSLLTGKLGGVPSQREVPISILPIV
jgi:hypothetical protein